AGWSYDDYISLKGKLIGGRKGIMRYDTLTVYGDVELHAAFELEEYPIHYYLNGAEIPGNNPLSYTVKSEAITLEASEKEGDVFTGWTGSNGDEPQQTVTIPEGSTGELYFYANFLYSGHENAERAKMASEDMIWATMDKLHIRTNKTGNIVKIYTADGILRESHTILSAGETKIELPQGLYIVTLNNSIARKISIK
ncbi:MAG: hypothetical protein LBS79_08665, partial [Tannerella sp.]|nr:hypothetical protein [Tannerella sp.]